MKVKEAKSESERACNFTDVSAQCKSGGIVVRVSADIRIQYRYGVGCLLQVSRHKGRKAEKVLRRSSGLPF
jgi:hypothetical protein